MSKKIKIILLEEVPKLGQAGDIVEASEGFARNFLFPQGKAALATEQAEKEQQAKQNKLAQEQEKALLALQKKADNLANTELVITARIKDGTDIYGKITADQIAKKINESTDLQLKAKNIDLPQPITTTGTYDITVQLSPDIETIIKVAIEPDPDSLPNSDEE